MTEPDSIVCKPTPWFLLRAVAIFLMFGVFAVLFYHDGSIGYRKKNESYFLHKTFQRANADFSEMNAGGKLTAEEWRSHAQNQTVNFGDDPSVLPASLTLPMAWPAVLQDYDKMKPLQWNILWREYTKERGMNADPIEKPFDAGKINEQWIVFGICAALAAGAAFILLRTLRRSITADSEGIVSQTGKRVPYTDMKSLDLRKWDTKGLAFLDYDGSAGKGRVRIDGLTYGGFKKEHDEPAERLMRRIRSRFSGEIIEYTHAPIAESSGNESSAAETSDDKSLDV